VSTSNIHLKFAPGFDAERFAESVRKLSEAASRAFPGAGKLRRVWQEHLELEVFSKRLRHPFVNWIRKVCKCS